VRTTILAVGQVVAFDPFDSVRLGITALPNANATDTGGLITRGSSTGQLVVAGGIANASVQIMAANTLTASALAADAVAEIQTGLATSAAVSALPSAAAIADAVWDEAHLGHMTSGTFGASVNANVVSMEGDVVTASALASDAVTEIQSGLATSATLDTVLGLVGTISSDTATIKGYTDSIPDDVDAALSANHGEGAWGGGSSASDVALAVWGYTLESTYTAEQIIRLITAVIAGVGTDLDGPNPSFYSLDGSKLRISGVTDDETRTPTIGDLT